MVLVYVDDIIIDKNNLEKIKRVKTKLKEMFDIKDQDLLREIRKLRCKPIFTLIDSKVKLNLDNGKPLDNINQFQRLVQKLIYFTVIRMNILFSISQISQFIHSPQTQHLEVINRVLRYLKVLP
jgi:hypothetical protein